MKINNLADVTLEELEAAQDSLVPEEVIIKGTEYGRPTYAYSLKSAIAMKKAIKEIIDGIPPSIKDDKKAAFAYVYVKLAYMLQKNAYHEEIYFLSGYYLDRAEDAGIDFDVSASENLSGLLTGKTLWKGQCLILEEIAKELGIEARTIYGGACFYDRKNSFSSWTQVKFDDTWYNCDLYSDVKFIKSGNKLPRFLKSDADANFYYKPRYKVPEPCNVSISDEEQERLITPARDLVLEEIAIQEQKRQEEEARQLKEKREREVSEQVEQKLKRIPSFLMPYVKEKIERKVRAKHIKRHGNW